MKTFYVGFHKHSQRSSNIKKKKFVRKFKIPLAYLNELIQCYPNFGSKLIL